MPPSDLITRYPADIRNLNAVRDVPTLIRCMGHPDPRTRTIAVDTLTGIGASAVPALHSALRSPRTLIRLGAIEALGGIRDPASARPLINLLGKEKHTELKFAAVLALGGIKSPNVILVLIQTLGDRSQYLRYAATVSLDRLGWETAEENDRIRYLIARRDWDAVRASGAAAVQPLRDILCDPDPRIRSRITSILGEIGTEAGIPACEAGLRDRDPTVRRAAVLAAMDCGMKPSCIPLFVASRERTGPNPAAAAILNFLFLGLGYNYIGKWWGFPVFMAYMSVIVLAQLATGPFLPYLVAYPVTAVLGVHTYYVARGMSDR